MFGCLVVALATIQSQAVQHNGDKVFLAPQIISGTYSLASAYLFPTVLCRNVFVTAEEES